MKPKLIELTEILKQKPEIKERLEKIAFGCWIINRKNGRYYRLYDNYNDIDDIIIGHEPAYHDVLEYLGENISLKYLSLEIRKKREYKK